MFLRGALPGTSTDSVEFKESMLSKTLVLSVEEGIGRTSLCLGAAALMALRGEQAGYFAIGFSRGICTSFDPENYRSLSTSSPATTAGVYSSKTCEAQLTVAELEIQREFPVRDLPAHVHNILTGIPSNPEHWYVDWKLPVEWVTASISHDFREVWLVEGWQDGEPLEAQGELTTIQADWIRVPILPDDFDEPAADLVERCGSCQTGIVLQRSAAPVIKGAPQVLAEPFSRNAVSIAAFLHGRYSNEG